jgi:putative hemolysin
MFGIEVLIIVVLILANGFFAAAELAIVSARPGRLETQARAGNKGAKQALRLADKPELFLATAGVGIELIGTFTAAFGGDQLGEQLTVWLEQFPMLAPYEEGRKALALVLVVIPIAYLTMLLGELVPKRLALLHAESIATRSAPFMTGMAVVIRPAVTLLTGSANLVLRLIGQHRSGEKPITEEDIVYMVREGTASGTVEAGEAQFINRVFRFTDRPVRLVMTPRTEITTVDVDTPLPQMAETFLKAGYSRLPVQHGSLDNIIGILYAKDLLRALTGPGPTELRALLREPVFVFENQPIDEALAEFRQKGTHIGLVLDEYGQVAGLLTLTDVLEELVGEMPEENSGHEDRPFVQREDGSWLVDGLEPYDTVRERLGLPEVPPEERGDYSTLAGMVLARLGRVPVVGDSVTVGDQVLEVVDMDGLRIDRVLVRRRDQAPPQDGSTPSS